MSMEKSSGISVLAAIMNLLTFTSTVNAQILEKNEAKALLISPFNNKVNGTFDTESNSPLKKYFVNVNGILRIDEKSIALKPKDQFHAQIRVEVDKGSLFLGGRQKTEGYQFKVVKEGKLDNPVDINKWGVNRLNYEDRDITISIYDIKTEKLLEQKKYKLNPDTIGKELYSQLNYIDTDGDEKSHLGFEGIYKSSVNFDAPMKVVVTNDWGDTYKVTSFRISQGDAMYSTLRENTVGDTISTSDKNYLRNIPKGRSVYITDIKYLKEGELNSSLIEIYWK